MSGVDFVITYEQCHPTLIEHPLAHHDKPDLGYSYTYNEKTTTHLNNHMRESATAPYS